VGGPRPTPREGRTAFSARRVLSASVEDVWERCTTRAGLAAWWGPEDVRTTVEELDVRVGGPISFRYHYTATENDARWRAELEAKEIATTYASTGAFREVVPGSLLAFDQVLDFGPGPPRTHLEMRVELTAVPGGTEVRLRAASTPNPHWRTLGAISLEGQLDRMARAGRPRVP